MKKVIILFTSIIITSVIITSCSKTPSTNLVEVTAKDYYFHMQDSIPSGWTTFRLKNEGHATHFFFLTLLPEGFTFQNYISEVGPAFVSALDTLKAGATKAEAGAVLGNLLPKWYASAKYMGGTGLIAMGKSTETTLKLAPGNYVMECYVKTQQGKFHSELGMIRPVTVTNEVSEMKEPENADIEINLSNSKMEIQGEPSSGKHTVSVHFSEQPPFGLGNDVHLVKLNNDTDLNKVIEWMDWMNTDGLQSPAPAEFMGGTQEMPVGYTSYFNVNLKPGRYAWISEAGAANGMVKEFTVD
jgi:hypothetical protein